MGPAERLREIPPAGFNVLPLRKAMIDQTGSSGRELA